MAYAGEPVVYHAGYLTHWRPGMDTILTTLANDIDVWMSVYIGAGFAVGTLVSARDCSFAHAREKKMSSFSNVPKGRGDFALAGFVGYGF